MILVGIEHLVYTLMCSGTARCPNGRRIDGTDISLNGHVFSRDNMRCKPFISL